MKFIPKPITGSLKEVVESVLGDEVRHSIYMYMGEVQINGSSMEHWALQHTCKCRGATPQCVSEGKTALDVMNEEMKKNGTYVDMSNKGVEIPRQDSPQWYIKDEPYLNEFRFFVRGNYFAYTEGIPPQLVNPENVNIMIWDNPAPEDIVFPGPSASYVNSRFFKILDDIFRFLISEHTLEKNIPGIWLKAEWDEEKTREHHKLFFRIPKERAPFLKDFKATYGSASIE